jgi:spore germination cell wall hydrolase CwlJ-like protein
MYKQGFDITNGATHYHAVYVNPKWSTSGEMRRTGKVDSHVFYKWEIKS